MEAAVASIYDRSTTFRPKPVVGTTGGARYGYGEVARETVANQADAELLLNDNNAGKRAPDLSG